MLVGSEIQRVNGKWGGRETTEQACAPDFVLHLGNSEKLALVRWRLGYGWKEGNAGCKVVPVRALAV